MFNPRRLHANKMPSDWEHLRVIEELAGAQAGTVYQHRAGTRELANIHVYINSCMSIACCI